MNKEAQIIDYLSQRAPNLLKATVSEVLQIDIGTTVNDDCVVICWPGQYDLVVGSDFVRGTGFQLFNKGKISLKDIGYFLVAANASDLAAMGATPIGFLDVLRYTKDMNFKEIQEILDGILEACEEFRMPLIGGDSGGYELPVVSGTALGICRKQSALLRRNGKPGDIVYVGGTTGIAGAANTYFGNDCDGQLSPVDEQALLDSWRRPQPQLELGKFLTDKGFSKCAIDTSDGLRTSIEQLSQASILSMVVQLEKVPIAELVRKVAAVRGFRNRNDLYHFVFSDSVDFRLLFAVPKEVSTVFEAEATARDFRVYPIGYLTAEFRPGEIRAIDEDGVDVDLPGVGGDQSEVPSHIRLEDLIRKRGFTDNV